MNQKDIDVLIDWLGPKGAIAGLERSKFVNAELMVFARERGVPVSNKASRKQIVVQLVMSNVNCIDKPVEQLMKMSQSELKRYFSDKLVSDRELNQMLQDLDIAPGGSLRGKLLDYAARELSDLGVFLRVAQGGKKRE